MKTKGMIAAVSLIALSSLLGACSSQPWNGLSGESIVISAPPEKVFAFIDNEQNNLKINPNLKQVQCEGTGLDKKCTWRLENFGEVYEGRTLFKEHVPNRRIVAAARTDDGRVALITTTLVLPHPQGAKLVRFSEWVHVALPAVLSKLPHEKIQEKVDQGLAEELQKIKTEVEKT